MISKIGGLRTAIYKVSDINAAKQWYEKAFETKPYFDEPFYVGFNIDRYELGLQPDASNIQKGESVAAYWATNDVQSTYDRLISLGASPNEAPQNVGGDIIVATVQDPWKNVIGLIFNPALQAFREVIIFTSAVKRKHKAGRLVLLLPVMPGSLSL